MGRLSFIPCSDVRVFLRSNACVSILLIHKVPRVFVKQLLRSFLKANRRGGCESQRVTSPPPHALQIISRGPDFYCLFTLGSCWAGVFWGLTLSLSQITPVHSFATPSKWFERKSVYGKLCEIIFKALALLRAVCSGENCDQHFFLQQT